MSLLISQLTSERSPTEAPRFRLVGPLASIGAHLRAIIGAMDYHLAQFNIGRIHAPVDHPSMQGFTGRLDEINAIADRSPGFVWRLQTEEGNATGLHPYGDPMMIVNLSVWEDVDSFEAFTYRSDHKELLRGRRDWFEKHDGPYQVMWWVPAGHVPTVEEAKARLQLLVDSGPSAEAFTFRNQYPAPE